MVSTTFPIASVIAVESVDDSPSETEKALGIPSAAMRVDIHELMDALWLNRHAKRC